jgi:hypothetical protein
MKSGLDFVNELLHHPQIERVLLDLHVVKEGLLPGRNVVEQLHQLVLFFGGELQFALFQELQVACVGCLLGGLATDDTSSRGFKPTFTRSAPSVVHPALGSLVHRKFNFRRERFSARCREPVVRTGPAGFFVRAFSHHSPLTVAVNVKPLTWLMNSSGARNPAAEMSACGLGHVERDCKTPAGPLPGSSAVEESAQQAGFVYGIRDTDFGCRKGVLGWCLSGLPLAAASAEHEDEKNTSL